MMCQSKAYSPTLPKNGWPVKKKKEQGDEDFAFGEAVRRDRVEEAINGVYFIKCNLMILFII